MPFNPTPVQQSIEMNEGGGGLQALKADIDNRLNQQKTALDALQTKVDANSSKLSSGGGGATPGQAGGKGGGVADTTGAGGQKLLNEHGQEVFPTGPNGALETPEAKTQREEDERIAAERQAALANIGPVDVSFSPGDFSGVNLGK